MSLVIGIDYSITSPAMCVYEGKPEAFAFEKCQLYSLTSHQNIFSSKNLHFKLHKDFPADEQIARFDHIASWAMKEIHEFDSNDIDVVGIEGYAMGAKGQVFNIAENTAILKYRLFESGIRFATVPPTTVKKFATGKGSGKKDGMFEQFVKDTGVDLKAKLQPNRQLGSPTTDLIDAFYICKYFLQDGGRQG